MFGACVMAENGADGMTFYLEAMARSKPFDLICIDLIMPKMNGHRVVRAIRDYENKHAVSPRSILFAVTSVDTIYDKSELLLDNLCDNYLVKPCDPILLTADLYKWGLGKR